MDSRLDEMQPTFCPECGVIYHIYRPSKDGDLCNDCWDEMEEHYYGESPESVGESR